MTHEHEGGCVWIRTTPGPGTTYRVALEVDADTAFDLDVEGAFAHARAVLAATARAEHDATVVAQVRRLSTGQTPPPGLDAESLVGMVLGSLRVHRAPLKWPTPFRLEPGVSAATGEGFLSVMLRDVALGQWSLVDAREHAAAAVEAVEAAELDAAYLTLLLGQFDLPEDTARMAVADLARQGPTTNSGQ